jgi:DNA-binding winged helix-turn-helix (wHTH) protein
MTDERAERRYRFGVFEADAASGELRRQGLRVKLNTQPFQVLQMLLERPGVVLTREEICQELWPDGTFVDYEHGVNSAINRIRQALGDQASHPRFVETLARRGYRFIAPVEQIGLTPVQSAEPAVEPELIEADTQPRRRILASTEELPEASYRVVRTFFILLQIMYMGFYVGALANLAEIEDLLSPLPRAALLQNLIIVTAALLIPARAFILSATFFHAPRFRGKFLKLWPFLLPLDELWALAPFLLLHHINFGLAVACMTLLVYSPFAQRSLVLMGAAKAES